MAVAATKVDAVNRFDPAHRGFATTESPFYWLSRVLYGHVQEMDRALKRIELDVPRWRVLTILTEITPASVSTLAEHGAIKLPTMMKTVQRMDADGMVKMRAREADGRVTDVVITAKGKKLVSIARSESSRIFRHTFKDMDETALQHFVETLKRIDANIHALR